MKINITALKKLVEVLKRKTLPTGIKNFKMGEWFELLPVSNGKHSYCGTAACAVGCAASSKWFRNRGLSLRKHEKVGIFQTIFEDGEEIHADWSAVEEFFGLSDEQANYLFGQTSYKQGKKSDVIRRVERFIAKNS